jgi:HD superfamily phosphohydrolase
MVDDEKLDKALDGVLGGKLKALAQENNELKTELNVEKEKADRLSDKSVRARVDMLIRPWLQPSSMRSSRDIEILDPLHGLIKIEKELTGLYHQPLVQRIANVRQLSFSYLEHSMAQHTRLAHSIGVAHYAQIALEGMIQKGILYTSSGEKDLPGTKTAKHYIFMAKICGLLHDIGHGPFGHAVDRYVGYHKQISIKTVDKTYSGKYILEFLQAVIKEIDVSPKIDPVLVAKIISPKKAQVSGKISFGSLYDLVADLIDSALDVDRMDYLSRDAYSTGISLGFIKPKFLIDNMAPFQDKDGNIHLAYSKSILPYIEQFLYGRDLMYARCYENDLKSAAEWMLVNAIDDFNSKFDGMLDKLMLLNDDAIISLFLSEGSASDVYFKLAQQLRMGVIYKKIDEYRSGNMADDDYKSRPGEIGEKIHEEISSQYVYGHDKGTVYYEFPQTVKKQILQDTSLKDEPWKVILDFPSPNIVRQDVPNVSILRDDGRGTDLLTNVSPIYEDLTRAIQKSRFVIRVFGANDLTDRQIDEVVRAAKTRLQVS